MMNDHPQAARDTVYDLEGAQDKLRALYASCTGIERILLRGFLEAANDLRRDLEEYANAKGNDND